MMRTKRLTAIRCGSLLGPLLAVAAFLALLSGSNADRFEPLPPAGETFLSAANTPAQQLASLREWGIAGALRSPSRLPATMRRGRTTVVGAPETAGLGLPMVGALVGMLGLAVHGNPRPAA